MGVHVRKECCPVFATCAWFCMRVKGKECCPHKLRRQECICSARQTLEEKGNDDWLGERLIGRLRAERG